MAAPHSPVRRARGLGGLAVVDVGVGGLVVVVGVARGWCNPSLIRDRSRDAAGGCGGGGHGEPDRGVGFGLEVVSDLRDLGSLRQSEGLTFLYIPSEGSDHFDKLTDTAIWQSMPFARAGRVQQLEDGPWPLGGGPASLKDFLDQLVVIFGTGPPVVDISTEPGPPQSGVEAA